MASHEGDLPRREIIKSNLYEEFGPSFVRNKRTAISSSTNPKMQIEVKLAPTRMISDSTPRKAPSPPTATAPALSMRSTTSQDTLQQSEKEVLKEVETYHFDLPRESEMTSFEVDALRSKVELLELKLEEMTQKVHVSPPRRFDLCSRCYNGTAIRNDKLHWKIGLLSE